MFKRFFSQYHGQICKYLLAVVFLTLSTLSAHSVEIPDTALDGAIRQTLGKPTGELTEADLASLTSLQAGGLNITSLSGLEAAVNLTSLHLWHNQISDISALSGLTSLTELYLWVNQISDISALSGLTNLTELIIWNNQITDISALSGLTNLTYLDLEDNQITDIGALAGLINLRDGSGFGGPALRLGNNLIDVAPGSAQRQIIDNLNAIDGLTVQIDLDPILGLEQAIRDALGKPSGEITVADMESLTSLDASNNRIADLTDLMAAVNLVSLDLNDNQISDLSALSGLTSLQSLFLDNNQISDISLSGLTSLTNLYLRNNQISDISALSGLTSLKNLWLSDNQISNLSPLSGLTQLSQLWLENNLITDIGALAGLINLQDVFIAGPGPLPILFEAALRLEDNFIDLTLGSAQQQIIDDLNSIYRLTVTYEPQNVDNLDIFQGQPIDGFPGWKASPWYLNYSVDFWPWIYHDEHGWQFVFEEAPEGVIFLWDLGLQEWVFLNGNTYRWLFLFGDSGGWIWCFADNTPGSRFFQRFDNGSLFSVPAGLPVE